MNREIKSLGTPNIGAIEEFDRVNTRYTYLSEQRTDVEKAKEELTGVIDEITRQMTEIFAQQFPSGAQPCSPPRRRSRYPCDRYAAR